MNVANHSSLKPAHPATTTLESSYVPSSESRGQLQEWRLRNKSQELLKRPSQIRVQNTGDEEITSQRLICSKTNIYLVQCNLFIVLRWEIINTTFLECNKRSRIKFHTMDRSANSWRRRGIRASTRACKTWQVVSRGEPLG